MMSDYPRADVPLDGVYESENVLLFNNRGEVRHGTRLLDVNHANLPSVEDGTGISASKSGATITISAGYTLSSDNIGDYFVWSDNGENELITAVDGSSCTVTSSSAHDATTTGRIRSEVNEHIWDKINKKHVIHIGTKIYYANYDATEWTEAYFIGTVVGTVETPSNTKSKMRQFGDSIYMWNANGKYNIRTNHSIPTTVKLNNTIPDYTYYDIEESSTLVYGRRYVVTNAEMSGDDYRENIYDGNILLRESPPTVESTDGRDYTEIFTENPISTDNPSKVFMGTSQNSYTHYRIYATKDIGVNGINASTGIGNNPELYIHVDDIPIVNTLVVSIAVDGTVTASKGEFRAYNVGSKLYVNSSNYTITAFASTTEITIDASIEVSDEAAVVGWSLSLAPFKFNQSGVTVTAEGSTPFTSAMIGDYIYVSDGSLLLITGYTSSSVVTVAQSATKTSVGGYVPVYGSYTYYNDSVTDDKLSTRISKAWCKNRFWAPLPNCDIGVELDGFFASAVKGESAIYFTQLANTYLAGYYDPEFQVETVEDSIQALRVYPSLLSAICSQSTVSWPTEVTGTDSRPEIGSSVTFLVQKKPVDYKIGTNFPESIVSVHEGIDIMFTNSCEIRLFNGQDYGPNLAEGKNMKKLRRLQPMGAASYDPIGGYYLWGTDGSLTTISGVDRLPFPDVCWRFAIREEQGVIGGIKITGDDWLMPPNGVNGQEITDDDNHALQVVLDNKAGKFYWISTYNGPTGSGLSKTFVDKDDTTGEGTEISWALTYGADIPSRKDYSEQHELTHLTIDPDDPSNADGSGYDSEGFRSGLEVDLTAYCRSNNWEEYSTANDVTKDGDITFDETPKDKAIQIKVAGNRSECVITELINYYTILHQAAVPSKRTMSEGGYQENLAAPDLWLSRNPSLYLNLATGSSITGTPTEVTGVDGKSKSAFQISAALDTISVTWTDGSILFWADGTVAVTIGGNSVSLSEVGSTGGWTLYYATGISESGTLTLTPSGTRKIEDVRGYDSEIDSDTRTYLYNDMVRNNGDNTMRLW